MNWMRWSGLILVLLFYATYFVKSLLLKQQGIRSGRIMKGRKPARTKQIECVLLPVTCVQAVVQILSIVLAEPSGTPWYGIGLVIGSVGVLFFMAAVVQMKTNWRAGVDETQSTGLVTEGIYRISRNPAFVGFDLFYLGLLFCFWNPIYSLTTAASVLLLHLQILEEENFLKRRFGESYRTYRIKTARYLISFSSKNGD